MNDIALQNVGEIDRRTYIGGSDVAAILGLSPYGKTPLTCYMAKIGELQGTMDPEKKLFLERRKRWEGPIVEMLREEFDGQIIAVNQRYVDDEHDFLAAEIDFEWVDGDGVIQNGEIKTVSPFAFSERAGWGEAGSADVPVHYHAQCLHGLGVMKRDVCVLAAMAGLDTMVFYRIDRDEEAITEMRRACVDFWVNNVLARVPPEPVSMADMAMLFNRRNGTPVELDAEAAQAFENLRLARQQMTDLEGVEDDLKLKVAKAILKAWGVPEGEEPPKDNAILTYDGKTLGKWARGRGASLDQKRLAIEHPEIKAAYMRAHEYRAFKFEKGKAA